MSKEPSDRPAHRFDPCQLLDSAEFFKLECEDVSGGLRALEHEILQGLTGDSGAFEGSIPEELLPELGAEIFDTLLSNYLKWYRCSLIAVSQAAEQDCLSFAGYARIERPHHLGLGVAYEMANAVGASTPTPLRLRSIGPIPGSVHVVVDASLAVRAVVAAMNIEKR